MMAKDGPRGIVHEVHAQLCFLFSLSQILNGSWQQAAGPLNECLRQVQRSIERGLRFDTRCNGKREAGVGVSNRPCNVQAHQVFNSLDSSRHEITKGCDPEVEATGDRCESLSGGAEISLYEVKRTRSH